MIRVISMFRNCFVLRSRDAYQINKYKYKLMYIIHWSGTEPDGNGCSFYPSKNLLNKFELGIYLVIDHFIFAYIIMLPWRRNYVQIYRVLVRGL